jgi:hypothetical protein
LLKLEAGAGHEVHGRGIYLVLSGAGSCEGKALKQYTTLFIDYGETAHLHASEVTEFLHYGLPDLSDLAAAWLGSRASRQAAE